MLFSLFTTETLTISKIHHNDKIFYRSSTTTESSGVYIAHGRELPVDEDGRIEPYVDFGPFYKLWNARFENGASDHELPNMNM